VSIRAEHRRSKPASAAGYLAVMSRAVFQAGLSWAAIDRQWKSLCDAFQDFNPRLVARYRAQDISRILKHPGILHSRRKIAATIANAKTMLELEREFGSVASYLRSFRGYDALAADLKRRFSNVGDVSAYYFVYRVGGVVPPFGRWIKTVAGDHPRIKEMVGTQNASRPTKMRGRRARAQAQSATTSRTSPPSTAARRARRRSVWPPGPTP
jgi:3-methyladenine DNA glycosylase Tag